MGVYSSCVEKGILSDKDAEEISKQCLFTIRQIFILSKIFRNLTKGSVINTESFCKNMGIRNPSIGEILYKIIDTDGSGQLDFLEFVQGLNKFHPDAPFDEKVRLCFQAYDSDGSGAVSSEEIEDVIRIALFENNLIELENAQITQIVRKLINQYDDDGSGELDYNEFYDLVSAAPGVIESFDIDLDLLFAE